MQTAHFQGVYVIAEKTARFAAICLLLIALSAVAFAQRGGGNGGGGGGNGGGGGGGNGGGGGGGDAFITKIVYTAQTCPLPFAIKSQYLVISFCGLGKRSRTTNFSLLVDGYTNLLPGTTLDVSESVPVVLPCGNISALTRFNSAAFAQTSPPPPPYRMTTVSTPITDTCL